MTMALRYSRTTKLTILTTTIMTMITILSLTTYGTFSTGGKHLLVSGYLGWVSFVLQGFFLAYIFVCFVAGAVGLAVLGWSTLGEMSLVKPMSL